MLILLDLLIKIQNYECQNILKSRLGRYKLQLCNQTYKQTIKFHKHIKTYH